MKKLLLASLALVASVVSVFAQDKVIDFKTATPWDKNNAPTFPYTMAVSGVDITFENSNAYIFTDTYGNYKDENGQGVDTNVLFLNKSTPKGAIKFSVDYALSKISFKSTMGGATGSGAKVKLMAGDVQIAEVTTNKEKGSEYVFELGENGAAGTVYEFVATGSSNVQMETITLYVPTTKPTLSLDDKALNLSAPLNATSTKTVKVNAENITGNITATCANTAFTVPASFTAEQAAAGIEISFTGTEADEYTSEIVFSADGAESVKLPVSAVVVGREGTATSPLTVSDVIALNNNYTGEIYVTGVINDLTAANASNGKLTTVASTDKNQATNIVLKEGDDMIGIKLPSGETRTTLNIVDNPTNVGKTVVIKGKALQYFGAPGIENTVYVSGLETAVDGIDVDASDVAPVYYNLQGVRVANPDKGIYIVVKGNKTSKVAF